MFAAWLNHDDSRGLNSLDMLEGPEGRKYIRHYMFDFGSIMGSGSTVAQKPRAGNEYILEWGPALKTLATLGLYVRPWILVDYESERYPSAGRFEADFFDPVAWRPEYPNPAFDNMRADDAFWAARLVSRFSDEAIRAVVAKARYSDARAAAHLTETLIKRRDKVLKTWLTGVNPIVDPVLGIRRRVDVRERGGGRRRGIRAHVVRVELVTIRQRARAIDRDARLRPASRSRMPRHPEVSLKAATSWPFRSRRSHPEHPTWTPVDVVFRRSSAGLADRRIGADTDRQLDASP